VMSVPRFTSACLFLSASLFSLAPGGGGVGRGAHWRADILGALFASDLKPVPQRADVRRWETGSAEAREAGKEGERGRKAVTSDGRESRRRDRRMPF